jgi:hypothetical protein
MTMDPKLITPILFAALATWAILRRLRRSFGRQRVQAKRMWFRIGALTLAGGLILATSAARNAQAIEAVVAGIACGAALGYLGLRHTQFEVTPEGRFYTPHTYIGLAVTALFLGRLIYRLLLSNDLGAMTGADQNLTVPHQQSPLTLGIVAALIGYYVLFYAGVLLKSRDPAPPQGPDPIA